MSEHPSKDIVGSYGDELKGKKIILCVTGSVAAYKAVELARLLMRHGADVHTVASKRALIFVTKDILSWATSHEAIVELTWKLEHITLVKDADIVIIYPCTAATLSKIAYGIDDTSVTTVASVALGLGKPLLIAVAMHEPMYSNPILKQSMERLEPYAKFIYPKIEEDKAKVAEPEEVLRMVVDTINRSNVLKGRRILVTAGATVEHIDPVRVVTNLSSGRFGVAIAREAMRMGADITLVYAHGKVEPPEGIRVIRVNTSSDMHETVMNELSSKRYDAVVMNAAVSDFRPVDSSMSKLDSKNRIRLTLEPTEKIVDKVKDVSPSTLLVAFKADSIDNSLVEKAMRRMDECNADMMVANDLKSIDSEICDVFIIDRERRVTHIYDKKEGVARMILEELARYLNSD
jgi:phosphopantothenoylcysteine decarboxylase/phosphopantothenate--cysteine ligase